MTLLFVAASFVGWGVEGGDCIAALRASAAQEDRRTEAKRLEEKAARTADARERDRYLAEAWALRAEAFALEGNLDAARDAWLKARALGWTGPFPTGRREEKDKGTTPQDEDNPLGVAKPFKPRERTIWEYFTLQPYASARNGASHNLIHLPPVEQAETYPAGTWHLQAALDFALTRFEDEQGNAKSRWNTGEATETLAGEYSLTDWIQFGLRVTFAELFGAGGDIRLFQNNVQIVPSGRRTFDVEAFVPRVKVAYATPIVDIGGLLEFKIPIAQEKNLVTAPTFDLSLSALLTRKFGDEWAIHANVGFVFPIGEADFFRDGGDNAQLPATNDMSGVFHFAAGVVWHAWEIFSIGLQFEGNTPVFRNVDVLNGAQFTVTALGRLKMSRDAFCTVALGTGFFSDLGPDFVAGVTFDFIL